MENKMEENLFNAVSHMIPDDMFNRISQNIVPAQERTVIMNTSMKRMKKWIGASIAACLLVGVGIFGGYFYVYNIAVDSIVDIDVNPSIELSTNKNDKVLNVIAINDDAKQILDGMDLKNMDLKVAVNAIMGSMVQNGYIIEGENGILVSVQNDNSEKASRVRNLVVSDIDESLKSRNITASIINQTPADSDTARKFAESNGISFGKSVFILNLVKKDASLDPTVLAKMNLRDIAALIKENKINIQDIANYDFDDSILGNISDAIDDLDDDIDDDIDDDDNDINGNDINDDADNDDTDINNNDTKDDDDDNKDINDDGDDDENDDETDEEDENSKSGQNL